MQVFGTTCSSVGTASMENTSRWTAASLEEEEDTPSPPASPGAPCTAGGTADRRRKSAWVGAAEAA